MARTSTFALILTGAFIFWMAKGFRGKFDDEMVSIADGDSKKGNIRYFVGLGFWILILVGPNELKNENQFNHLR